MTSLDELAKQSPEATRELVQLRAENARLRAAIDKANEQKPAAILAEWVGARSRRDRITITVDVPMGQTFLQGEKLYTKPIPSNRVAVEPRLTEDDLTSVEEDLERLPRNSSFFPVDAEKLRNCCRHLIDEVRRLRAVSARITEQDALALVGSAMHHYIFNDQNVNIDDWFEVEGRALLDKLNEGRRPIADIAEDERTNERGEPEAIYLQLHDPEEMEPLEKADYTAYGVTWCWHRIHNNDVRYIREDLPERACDSTDYECHHCKQEMTIGWVAEIEVRSVRIEAGELSEEAVCD